MKIEYVNKQTKFGDITKGTVFQYRDYLYMKTEGITNIQNDFINAVSLEIGSFHVFDEFDVIYVVNCKLVVE